MKVWRMWSEVGEAQWQTSESCGSGLGQAAAKRHRGEGEKDVRD